MLLLLLLQTDSSTVRIIRENSNKFLNIDPIGIGIAAIGMAVVFGSLLLLYISFLNVTKILNFKFKKPVKIEKLPQEKSTTALTGEISAAIAAALHLYLKEKHDHESAILTINKVSRTYSPWSSKIYGLRQYPR